MMASANTSAVAVSVLLARVAELWFLLSSFASSWREPQTSTAELILTYHVRSLVRTSKINQSAAQSGTNGFISCKGENTSEAESKKKSNRRGPPEGAQSRRISEVNSVAMCERNIGRGNKRS